MSVDEKLLHLEEKRKLIKMFFASIESSKMSLEEKKMWIALLPSMENLHIRKLVDSIQREVNEYANVYLSVLDSTT